MRTRMFRWAPALLALVVGASLPLRAQAPLSWPRTLTALDGTQVTFFQPQVDSWNYYVILNYHMAVDVQLPGASSSVPGALFMTAETSTNLGAQTVAIYNQKIVSTNFPGLDPGTAQQYQQLIQSVIPEGSTNVTLPQVQSYVAASQPAAAMAGPPPAAAGPAPHTGPGLPPTLAQPAPPIYYSESPAILVMFQGEPAFAPVTQGSKLFFSVNTNWAVFQDKNTGTYYLQDHASWLKAPGPSGPWQPATSLPQGLYNLPQNDEWADVNKNIPGMSWGPGQVPRVFVSQKPAELILVQGPPQLEAIPGTSLSWVTNSESDLFFYSPTSQWYYLVSGRWFSASSQNGPWTYATPNLPPDFANIPSDSPRAAVLSSVPGTPEANEAVAQAQMPHKAEVDIATTTVNVVYGGPPQFSPISGTSMQYATNTSYQVIQANGMYYVVSNAVWFVSQSPNGPWAVATSVPQVVYTIPPSSPMYNVTYVQIYDVTPTTVTTGYTSGYNGAYVAAGVVMLGVGMALAYSYHPYYPPGFGYPVYYHPPYPYTGYGYHAAYNPYTGAYAHGYSAYGPYGGASAGTAYNPTTGTYARGASASGPYGSASAAQAYNPRTGASAETYQHSDAYGSYGSSVYSKNGETAYTSHSSDAYGTTATAQTSKGGQAAGVSTASGTTAAGKTASGDQYATHDGNVYKNTGSGWEQGSSSGWSSVDKPPAETSSDAEARSSAESKSSSYSSYQGGGGSKYSGGSSGGYSGGYHGGGGGRR
jgi:hypothetical protein